MSASLLGQASDQDTGLTCYLPNPPQLISSDTAQISSLSTSNQQDDLVEKIIELNGNHWRKIFVISAKLACSLQQKELASEKQWKNFRQNELLKNSFFNICFADQLEQHNGWHIICGKQNWQRFFVGQKQVLREIAPNCYQIINKKIILAPYLDYRQFPNKLIALLCNDYFINN